MRLQRFLAIAGVASRRRAEQLIADGRVAVNGQIVQQPGSTVDPDRDVVEVDGERIETEEKVYALLNKPAGYLSAVTDARGHPTVSELTADMPGRLYPVGRLDVDTEGALLMTNDGELCHRLTHPKFGIEKTYHATVKGKPSNASLVKLRKGIDIDGGRTAPARIKFLGEKGSLSRLEITVHEGRKRQVKKMCKAIGHPVVKLRRVNFAGVGLGSLKPGESRRLSRAEVSKLRQLARISPE